jgi:hypothetical protein
MQKGPPKQEGSSRSYLCDHLEDMEQIENKKERVDLFVLVAS